MTDTPRLWQLPSISQLLDRPDVSAAVDRFGHDAVVEALRRAVDDGRDRALDGGPVPAAEEIAAAAVGSLDRQRRDRTQRVINATGVVLHTNLGRAPLSAGSADAMRAAAGYTNLEYDIEQGVRGRRGGYVSDALARACGAEAATVVNNGAAALVLCLAALAAGRETIVSRGELIEIGGSFRLPDIMASSGSQLREVGTTNRTRASDVADAISGSTGLILQVHPSNFRISGFTERPRTAELAAIARSAGVPLLVDVGAGLLDGRDAILSGEPIAGDVIREGADLLLFSGDKLLGGPQAGVIAGRTELVERCRTHPLARALRIDKFRLAALEVTLEEHAAGAASPTRAMLALPAPVLRERADALARQVGGEVVAVTSVAGGGSLPDVELPSFAVALPGPADAVLAALRRTEPAVIGRIVEDRAVLDVRTIAEHELDEVVAAVTALPALDVPGGGT